MRRGGQTTWTGLLIFGLVILAFVPFTFYLINSLSPTYIKTISLAKVTSDMIDPLAGKVIQVKVRVGVTGGCVWSSETNQTTCFSHIPYKPSPESIHMNPSTEKITSCFPIALGKALNLNHVTTALMGLSLMAIIIDVLVLQGGISISIVHFTVFFMWLTFIFETIYISVLHKRLDKISVIGSTWEYKIGEGYWLNLAATILVSLITCGGNFSIEF